MGNILNPQTVAENVNSDIPKECEVYFAQDIQKFLGIGRSRCYTYLEEVYQKQEPFQVIKIGKLFRVPKRSFDSWINRCS